MRKIPASQTQLCGFPLSSRLTVNPTDHSYAFTGYVPGVVYTSQKIPALMINLPPYMHLKCVIVLRQPPHPPTGRSFGYDERDRNTPASNFIRRSGGLSASMTIFSRTLDIHGVIWVWNKQVCGVFLYFIFLCNKFFTSATNFSGNLQSSPGFASHLFRAP